MARKIKGKGKRPQGVARQGRQNAFSGTKLCFLDSHKDEFLSSTDRSEFYTTVSKRFIRRFGYKLAMEENPEPDDDSDKHTLNVVDPLLPPDEQNKESDEQRAFYDELRKVSHL
jgi:hypothetical protein